MKIRFVAPSVFIILSMSYPIGSSAGNFMGYPCTENCSGHEAGYSWAEKKDITDESDCRGNSQSFIEGCQAYVEEIQQREEEEKNNSEGEDEEN